MRVIESEGVYVNISEEQGLMVAAGRLKGRSSWSYWEKIPHKPPKSFSHMDHLDRDKVVTWFMGLEEKYG